MTKIGNATGVLKLDVLAGYTGTTHVNGGEFRLGAPAGALAASSTLDVGASGTFNLDGNNQTVAQITGTGTITNDDVAAMSTSNLTVTGTSSFGGTLTDSAAVAGNDALNLSKTTGGTLTLTNNANAYTGTTMIASLATIQATQAGALGASGGGVGVDGTTVASGGTLEAAFTGSSGEELSIAGTGVGGVGALNATAAGTLTGDVTLAGTTVRVDDGMGPNMDFTISGDITGGFTLTKEGADTLVLDTGVKSYTGPTSITAGTIKAGFADVISNSVSVAVGAAGTFDANGTDQILNRLSGSGTVTNTSGGASTLTVDTTGTASTYTGAIDEPMGQVALIVNGDNVFTLGGATKAFTGKTTVDAMATLAAGAVDVIANTTDLEVTMNATFNLNGNNQTVGQLNGAGTVVNEAAAAGNTATLTINGGGTFTGTLDDTMDDDTLALAKTTAGTQILSPATGDYNGALTVTGGTLQATTLSAFGIGAGTTSVSGGGVLDLALPPFSALFEPISIAGVNATTGALVHSPASLTTLAAGVTLTGNATVDVSSAGGTLLVGNIGGGANELTKIGPGLFQLDTFVATYTGTTHVDGGEFRLANGGALAAGSTLDVGAAGTFNLNGQNQTLGMATGTGTITNDEIAAISTSTLTVTVTVTVTGTSTYDGLLTDGFDDTLNLSKTVGGTLTLSTGNIHSGTTTIASGATIVAGDPFALGTTGVGTTVSSGGTLEAAFVGPSMLEPLSLAGSGVGGVGALNATMSGTQSGTVTLAAPATIGVTGANTFTVSGGITSGGANTLTKVGTGTLLFDTIAKTYSGTTDIQAGTLSIGLMNAIPLVNTINVAAAGTFNLNGFDQQITLITGLSAFTNSSAGATTAELEVTGTTVFGGLLTDSTAGAGNDLLDLRKSTGGMLTLTNTANDYGGQTNIDAGTIIAITAAGALGANGTPGTNDTVVAMGGTLRAAHTGTSGEDLSLNGTGVGGIGALQGTTTATISGGIALAGPATINVDDSGGTTVSLTLSGNVTGGAANHLTKIGPDILVFAGNNTYSGDTNLTGGALQTTSTTAIGDASAVTIGAGTTLDLDSTTETVGSLAGAPTGTLDLGLSSLLSPGDINLTSLAAASPCVASRDSTSAPAASMSTAPWAAAATTSSSGTLSISTVTSPRTTTSISRRSPAPSPARARSRSRPAPTARAP